MNDQQASMQKTYHGFRIRNHLANNAGSELLTLDKGKSHSFWQNLKLKGRYEGVNEFSNDAFINEKTFAFESMNLNNSKAKRLTGVDAWRIKKAPY